MQGALAAGWEEMLERRPGGSHSWLKVVARLGAGASLEAARADLDVLGFVWEEEFGDWARSIDVVGVRMEVSPDPGFFPGEAERLHRTIWFLGIVAGAVLLIGCANLAILLLARGSAREGEIGVRAALGAGRGRLLRQLLTESAILAGVACVAGLALAYWGSGVVARLLPFYFAADMKPDGWVLLGTVAVTLVMTAAFGMAPALKLSRTDLGKTLRRQIRNTRRSPARSALVVGQIAASVVLVAGAGLFVRSVLAARSVELGFDPENRILVSVQLGTHGYDAESVQLFQGGVLERIRALPGVVSAALTDRGPFSGRWTSTLRPVGTEYEEEELTLSMNRVGAD
jgi:cell division protein FtsX